MLEILRNSIDGTENQSRSGPRNITSNRYGLMITAKYELCPCPHDRASLDTFKDSCSTRVTSSACATRAVGSDNKGLISGQRSRGLLVVGRVGFKNFPFAGVGRYTRSPLTQPAMAPGARSIISVEA